MYHIIHQHQSVVLQWSHMDRERKLSFPPLFVQFVATAFLFSPNPSALQIGESLLSLPDFLLYPPLSEQHDDIPASTVHPSSQPMNGVNSFFHLWLQIRCNLTKGLDDKWSNIFMDTEAPPHSISFLFSNPLLKLTILAKMIILYLQVLNSFFFCTHSCLRCWTESPLFGLQSWCCFVWIFHLNQLLIDPPFQISKMVSLAISTFSFILHNDLHCKVCSITFASSFFSTLGKESFPLGSSFSLAGLISFSWCTTVGITHF